MLRSIDGARLNALNDTRLASKVVPHILTYCATTLEADIGDMAEEVDPSQR